MSKTGGGPGTNQYGIKGVGKSPQSSLPRASVDDLELSNALSRNDYESEVFAVRSPGLDASALALAVKDIHPRSVERGLARFKARLSELVWNDSTLEGRNFTLPEVSTLLDGGAVKGHSEFDIDQLLDLSQAADIVVFSAGSGEQNVSDQLSSSLNAAITEHEIIEPGVLRGEGNVGGEGVVGVQEVAFVAFPTITGGEELRSIFNESMERANALDHPVARGCAWAGFGAYHQFYSNGNKRTSRYVMNTVLLSHGYDSIVTPASLKPQYNAALRKMFLSGDVTEYALFLASLYNDD
ncbi:MAG: hypothetical protein FWG08_04550 [Propionibacteriaceae bacterium]|jgi:hypothetical protein|nr:hypothetical protein [Propionibacteriaceae bacterium]